MRLKWFSRDSNQELIFKNEAGEDAANALPPSIGGHSGRVDAKEICMSRPKEVRLSKNFFWQSWPHLLDDVEIDGPPLTVKFQSESVHWRQHIIHVDCIAVNGSVRGARIKLPSGTGDELNWLVQSFPSLRLLFALDGHAAQGVSRLRDLKQLWGLLLLPAKSNEPNEESTAWSELNLMAQLRALSIGNFLDPKDISCLRNLSNLEHLEVRDARNIRSLKGIERCHALSSLKIVRSDRVSKVDELEALRSLESLELNFFNALENIGGVGSLVGLKRLNISSKTLKDIGPLAGHPNLEKVRLEGPGFNAEWAENRKVLKTLPQLESLAGFQPKILDEVLFCTAALRGDIRKMRRLLDDVISGHCDGLPEGASVRSVVIDQLMSLGLSDSEWQLIYSSEWTVAEWADLHIKTENCGTLLESQLAEFERSEKGTLFNDVPHLFRWVLPKDEGSHIRVEGRIEVKDAFKGYIHAVARDNGWNGSKQMIQFAASLFLENDAPHESWDEIQIDLLLATLELGLEEQHGQLLTHITDTQRSEFKEQLVWRRANEAVSMKRLDEAVECLPLLTGSKQSRLMGRLLPLWVEKVPDTIMDWFAEELPDLEQVAKMEGVPLEEVLQNPFAREVAFFLAATDLEDFQKLLANMQKAFPEDDQVKALMGEVGIGRGANQDVMETLGLEMLWQDEAFRAEVGARNLRRLMEARGEEAERVREQAKQAAMELLRREDLID